MSIIQQSQMWKFVFLNSPAVFRPPLIWIAANKKLRPFLYLLGMRTPSQLTGFLALLILTYKWYRNVGDQIPWCISVFKVNLSDWCCCEDKAEGPVTVTAPYRTSHQSRWRCWSGPVCVVGRVSAISHICHNYCLYCLLSIYKLHNVAPHQASRGQQGRTVIYHRLGVSFNGSKMQMCLGTSQAGTSGY